MNYTIIILSIIGMAISVYSMRVRTFAKTRKDYKPLCDIRENISCTKALLSKEGTLVGLPNPIIGAIIYAIILVLAMAGYTKSVCYIAMGLVAISIYLAYIAYVKQKNFCLVCTAVYVINILLVIVSWSA